MVPTSGVQVMRSARKRLHWSRILSFFRSELQTSLQPAAMAFCLFLLTFVNWFGIPSPFAAAMILMLPDKPPALLLSGLAASLGMRALNGLPMDWWQYAGCLMVWLVKRKCHPRAGAETAALGGFAMLPRVLAAAAAGNALDVLLSCAAVPVAMLSAAALRFGMDAARSTGTVLRGTERFCLLFFGLLVVSGLGYFRVGVINLGQLAAVWCVLAYAAVNGPAQGIAGGVGCALALALVGHDSGLVAVFGLIGFAGGFPQGTHMRWLALPSVLGSNLIAWFLAASLLPPLLWWTAGAGALAFALTPRSWMDRCKSYLCTPGGGARSMENAFVTQRITQMREAIQNLARALPQHETEEETAGETLGRVMCDNCSNRDVCWGHSRARTEKMLSAGMELSRKGEEISEETLPALAHHGCLRADEMTDFAREAHIKHRRRKAAAGKAKYERELTLTHLAALSGTLGELGAMTAGDSYNDLLAAHVITLAIEEMNMPARLSYARRMDGHLQAALEVQSLMPVQKQLEQLLKHLANSEGLALSVSRAEHRVVELEEIPLYSASVGMASLCADGDSNGVCGDACSAKRCEGGRLLMMLCDGMGHGEEAHKQSEKTLELLLLLLEAGYTRRQAITAVNGMMLGVEETERFSTVDLVDVDLWTGEVFGEKLGACASWVVRGSHFKKIEGSSLPLGILREASPTAAQYRLHSGDILVMVSDGVADVFENDAQWKLALENSIFIHPQRMADAILRNALLAAGGTPRDDMSVMVLLMMDRNHTA